MTHQVTLVLIILLLAAFIVAAIAFFFKSRELKKANEDLNFLSRKYRRMTEINRKRKSLASILSHDLSTPFASIDMWVQLLNKMNEHFDPEQKKAIEMIQGGSQYGQSLIRKIVELESIIPEKIIIEDFDFSLLIKSIIAASQTLLQNGMKFKTDIPESIFLLSDKELIKKICGSILTAVIGNAEKNSEIKLSLSKKEDAVVFSVGSEAVDYAKNKVNNLFSDYKQISSKKNAEPELAPLSIAHRIAIELNSNLTSGFNEFGESVITVMFRNS